MLDQRASFACDIKFLVEHAPVMLNEKIDAAIQRCFPSGPGHDKGDFEEALANMRRVHSSALVTATNQTKKDQIVGALDMIENLEAGRPPRDADIPKLTAFSKMVLKKTELLCVEVQTTMVKHGGKLKGLNKNFYGAEAAQLKFSKMKDRMASDPTAVRMPETLPLKQFSWLLTPEQRVQFRQWIAEIGKHANTTIWNKSVKDKAQDKNKEKATEHGTPKKDSPSKSGASSNSTSIVRLTDYGQSNHKRSLTGKDAKNDVVATFFKARSR